MDVGSYMDFSRRWSFREGGILAIPTLFWNLHFSDMSDHYSMWAFSLPNPQQSKNAFPSLSFADWFINFSLTLGAICLTNFKDILAAAKRMT